jgi:hypothetical protein
MPVVLCIYAYLYFRLQLMQAKEIDKRAKVVGRIDRLYCATWRRHRVNDHAEIVTIFDR